MLEKISIPEYRIKVGNKMKRNIPKIYMEFSLIFDNDTSMELITKEIGLNPTSFKDKKEQRKSPFKDDNLEGFWSIQTEEIDTFYFEEVSKIMVDLIKPYVSKIKRLMTKFNGSADFCIVPHFYPLDTPAICFNREFLDIVNDLNATIQIDMYVI